MKNVGRYINSIIFITEKKVLLKLPLYNELYYLFKDHNIAISKNELFFQYYFKISLIDEKVICSEVIFNSLSEIEKRDVLFVALRNKKIRILKNRIFWLPVSNIRGDHKLSFVDNLIFLGSHILDKDIKKIDPQYPFIRLDKFSTKNQNIDLDILDIDVQFFPSLNYNPWFFISSSSIDERNFFSTKIGITDKEQIDDLTNNDKKRIKKIYVKRSRPN